MGTRKREIRSGQFFQDTTLPGPDGVVEIKTYIYDPDVLNHDDTVAVRYSNIDGEFDYVDMSVSQFSFSGDPEARFHFLEPNADKLWRVYHKLNNRNMKDPGYYQRSWVDGFAMIDHSAGEVNWCGTSMCFAGWAAHLDDDVDTLFAVTGAAENRVRVTPFNFVGYEHGRIIDMSRPLYRIEGESLELEPYIGPMLSISEWARREMRLSSHEAAELFSATNTLDNIYQVLKIITSQEPVVLTAGEEERYRHIVLG